MPLEFSLVRKPPPWKRLARWLWVLAVPALALLAFAIFLDFNRIGNEFPKAPAASARQVEEPPEALYVREPELYFTLWRSDSAAGRRRILSQWRAERGRLAGEEDAAKARRLRRIAAAIKRLEKLERAEAIGP